MNENDLNNQDISSLPRSGDNSPTVDSEAERDDNEGRTFSQYWHMVTKHWVAVVICLLIGLAGGVVYGRVIKKPKYTATSQLVIGYLNYEGDSPSEYLNTSRQQASVANTYVMSNLVLESACEKLSPNYSEFAPTTVTTAEGTTEAQYPIDKLKEHVSSSLPKYSDANTSTSVLVNITGTAKTGKEAIDIANAMADSMFGEANDKENQQIYHALHDSITIQYTNEAKDTSTSNVTIALIGLLIGLVVGVLYAIIRELTDTHVLSKHELEQITGYKVIGMIPDYTEHPEDDDKGGALTDKPKRNASKKQEGGKE